MTHAKRERAVAPQSAGGVGPYARPGDPHFVDAMCALVSFHALTAALSERVKAGEPWESALAMLLRKRLSRNRRSRISKFLTAMLFDAGVDVAEYLDAPPQATVAVRARSMRGDGVILRAPAGGIGRKRHALFVAQTLAAVQHGLTPADAMLAAIGTVYPRLKALAAKRRRVARLLEEPQIRATFAVAGLAIN